MKDKDFEGLMRGLAEAREFAKGRKVDGLRVHAAKPVDVASIRNRAGLSQSAFSRQIGVSVGTLRNWEQGRRRPEGPARILLAMLDRDPRIVDTTLSGHLRTGS